MTTQRVTLVALAVGLACSRGSGTVEIPPEELPFPVVRTPASLEPTAPTLQATIYVVRHETLVPVERPVPRDVPRVEAVIRALLAGPTPAEQDRGLSTELPGAVRLLAVGVAAGRVEVDLSGEFQLPATPEAISLRVAQVVWTLTEIAGIEAVAFLIDGEPVSVTASRATSPDAAVTRDDIPVSIHPTARGADRNVAEP